MQFSNLSNSFRKESVSKKKKFLDQIQHKKTISFKFRSMVKWRHGYKRNSNSILCAKCKLLLWKAHWNCSTRMFRSVNNYKWIAPVPYSQGIHTMVQSRRYHQGLEGISNPNPDIINQKPVAESGKLISIPVLNALHHDYRLVA